MHEPTATQTPFQVKQKMRSGMQRNIRTNMATVAEIYLKKDKKYKIIIRVHPYNVKTINRARKCKDHSPSSFLLKCSFHARKKTQTN